MNKRSMTISLLVSLILAMLWATGRLQRIMAAVFGR